MADMKRITKTEYELLLKSALASNRFHNAKEAEVAGTLSSRHRFGIPQNRGKDTEWTLYLLHDRIMNETDPEVVDGEEFAALYLSQGGPAEAAAGVYSESGLTVAEIRAAAANRPGIVDPETFVASAPSAPAPSGEIAFGTLPAGSPAQSVAPGNYATDCINNLWWEGYPDCTGGCLVKGYASGWGRLTGCFSESGGRYGVGNGALIFRDVPAGSYSFATLGFTLDWQSDDAATSPVPVTLEIAQYDHAEFDGDGYVTNWVLNEGGAAEGSSGFFDPPSNRVIASASALIPAIPESGEGYVVDGTGNPVNVAGAIGGGGTLLFKFRQTNDAVEAGDPQYKHFRDFGQLFLHLWA